MIEVLCIWHRGIRCALPARQVLGAEPASRVAVTHGLWPSLDTGEAAAERSLEVLCAAGSTWISATMPKLLALSSDRLHGLPPALRDLVPLPHVVGLADVADELVWLIDAKRFDPRAGRALESNLGPITSKVTAGSRILHD
jgi:hypothetical protein